MPRAHVRIVIIHTCVGFDSENFSKIHFLEFYEESRCAIERIEQVLDLLLVIAGFLLMQ